MISEPEPNLDPSISRRFGTVADEASVKRTVAALGANGITVLRAPDSAAASGLSCTLSPMPPRCATGLRKRSTTYGIHGAVNKVVIINREITPGRITVVLVDEVLGF